MCYVLTEQTSIHITIPTLGGTRISSSVIHFHILHPSKPPTSLNSGKQRQTTRSQPLTTNANTDTSTVTVAWNISIQSSCIKNYHLFHLFPLHSLDSRLTLNPSNQSCSILQSFNLSNLAIRITSNPLHWMLLHTEQSHKESTTQSQIGQALTSDQSSKCIDL